MLGLEDVEGGLTPEQVAALPEERFLPRDAWPNGDYLRSSFLLRFDIRNHGDTSCTRWLSVGVPRLDNVQVYQSAGAGWSERHAGSRYPLAEWPIVTRLPLFPLVLEPGEQLRVVARISSDSVMVVKPRLWTEVEQLAATQTAHLVDGVILGIVMLVVPFSLIVALLMRSRLLLVHAMAILAYLLLVCAATGYIYYLPALLPWVTQIVSVLSCLATALFMSYVYVLFRAHLLPWPWRCVMILFTLSSGGVLLWGAVGHYLQTRILFSEWEWLAYIVVAGTCLVAWFRRLRPSWLAWLLTGLFMVQGIGRHVFDYKDSPWQFGEDPMTLLSVVPGAFMLVCTLIMEFSRSRRNERRAVIELELQQKEEQERLESMVARRTEQLHTALDARSSLLARISHDLRVPLASIIDYARLLRQPAPDIDYSQNIERNARYQMGLIDELLEFSRGQLLQMELLEAPGYLYAFLQELVEEGRFLAARQGNRLEFVYAEDLPPLVQTDFRRLRQVLMNLLANAAKFTHEGLIRFEVAPEEECSAQHIRLRFSVIDNGIGIDPADRERLLLPYRRGSNAEQYEGSGLGLSIVTQLLASMGSHLSIEASEPFGSRFEFVLELQVASENDLDAALGDSFSSMVNGAGRRVLVVDDVAMNREWLCDLLNGYGFEARAAADGEEALECLDGQPFDLILSDQSMPRMDGWALLQALRRRWPGLPVLLYSAAPPKRPAGFPSGLDFDARLLKPSDSSELLRTIDSLTASRLYALTPETVLPVG